MKARFVGLFLAGAMLGQPTLAAELPGPFQDGQRGAFAGIRLQALTGGKDNQMKAGLMVAPTAHSRVGANSRLAFGDALELSFTPAGPPRVTLAGQQLDRMSLFSAPEKDRSNLSTLATVAIVAGVVVVAGAFALKHVAEEASCFHGSSGDC